MIWSSRAWLTERSLSMARMERKMTGVQKTPKREHSSGTLRSSGSMMFEEVAQQPVLPLLARLLNATRSCDLAYKGFTVLREELAFAVCDQETRVAITAEVYRSQPQYYRGSSHNNEG